MITPLLETCKTLKEKGFKQDTVGNWFEISEGRIEMWWCKDLHMCTRLCAAPTAEEIADELPKVISGCVLTIKPVLSISGGWWVSYDNMTNNTGMFLIEKDNMTEALAHCWVWCVDNGHIKTQEGK